MAIFLERLEELLVELFVRCCFRKVTICDSIEKGEIGRGILFCCSFSVPNQYTECALCLETVTYNNSSRYGAEENDAFNPTFMDGPAEAHRVWRYVDANRTPVRPHGKLKTPIVFVGGLYQASRNCIFSRGDCTCVQNLNW